MRDIEKIKALRKELGLPVAECKKILNKVDWDYDNAISMFNDTMKSSCSLVEPLDMSPISVIETDGTIHTLMYLEDGSLQYRKGNTLTGEWYSKEIVVDKPSIKNVIEV